MNPKEFLLNNDYGVKYIFKVSDKNDNSTYLNGDLYEAISWQYGKVVNTEHIANLYLKWDACTHWYFNDEVDADIEGNYWHICGSDRLEDIIVMMAFVWKCAEIWMDKYVEKDNTIITSEYYKDFFEKHPNVLDGYKLEYKGMEKNV